MQMYKPTLISLETCKTLVYSSCDYEIKSLCLGSQTVQYTHSFFMSLDNNSRYIAILTDKMDRLITGLARLPCTSHLSDLPLPVSISVAEDRPLQFWNTQPR